MTRWTKIGGAVLAGALAASTAACSSGGAGTASGGEQVTVRFADTLPESHFISKDFSQRFIETAEGLAEGEGHQLEIDFYPDGQLGDPPDQIDNMRNGVFDMALVAPSYGPDQMPAGDVFNLPFMADTAEEIALAYYDQMQDSESTIYQRDFDQNAIEPLAAFALPLYQMAMTSEITGIDSIRGKKIRSGGGAQNDIIKALGGSPVTLTTAEQYEGLQRGIIDGGIFNTPSMIDNKTGEVLKSFTTNAKLGGFDGGLAISQEAWSGLPEWAQEILTEAGRDATEHFAGMVDELGEQANQTLVDEYGLTAMELPPNELERLQAELTPVRDTWAESVQGRGVDGQQVLAEAEAAIESSE